MPFSRLHVSCAAVACLAAIGAAGCIAAGQDTPDAGATGSDSVAPPAAHADSGAWTAAGSGGGSENQENPTGTDAGVVIAADDASTSPGHDGGGTARDAGTVSSTDASSPTSGYNIDLSQTSVSGFSSGAFVAVEFHVAFSSIVKGAAAFAGGPYDCAEASSTTAETTCMDGSPNASTYVTITKQNHAAGLIDDPANLANERVFIFGGADDTTVHPTVVAALDAYYQAFMSSSSIQYVSKHPGTNHTMPTLSYGSDCASLAAPYVGKCNYDGAGNALKQIYGTLSAPATTLSGKILPFSQGQFIPNPTVKGLADTGYYYVPASCASGEPCRIHVSFHGCEQTAAEVKDAYYGHAGYNEWADTNHIIVLYPQAHSSTDNDYDCWDFWGYDGSNYATKSGTQLAAVRAMVDWLAAGGASDAGAD